MDLKKLLSQPTDAATVGRVFGEPIERDGTTIIPVAKVMGGGGGGEGHGTSEGEDGQNGEASNGAKNGGGSGGGFGFRAVPAGVYVVKDGQVSWQPALNLNRVILGGQILGAIFIIIVGGLVRTYLKRREVPTSVPLTRQIPARVILQAARRLSR